MLSINKLTHKDREYSIISKNKNQILSSQVIINNRIFAGKLIILI